MWYELYISVNSIAVCQKRKVKPLNVTVPQVDATNIKMSSLVGIKNDNDITEQGDSVIFNSDVMKWLNILPPFFPAESTIMYTGCAFCVKNQRGQWFPVWHRCSYRWYLNILMLLRQYTTCWLEPNMGGHQADHMSYCAPQPRKNVCSAWWDSLDVLV